MPDYIATEQLLTYLVAQGVGQRWTTAPSLTVPLVTLLPRDGAPLPRDGENVTVTLVDTNLRGPPGLEAWIEEAFIDVIVRSRQPSAGKLVQRQIKGLLHPYDSNGGRKQWMMGALLVESSREWRGDQPLPQRQAIGESDPHVTYDRIASYVIGARRKILAGLTVP